VEISKTLANYLIRGGDKMRRAWVKLFTDQWLRGSIRKESLEVRAVFIDLLMLAGDSAFGEFGEIKLAEEVGFTDETIAGILNIPKKIWLECKERLSNHPDGGEANRIRIIQLKQGFAIEILNWKKYQSEYARQKAYREMWKEGKPGYR